MDSLSAAPICYSSLEDDELADLSGDEEEPEEDVEDEEDGVDDAESAGVNLRDLHVRPRFSKWLSQLPPGPGQGGQRQLLLEIFGLLELTGHEIEVVSSERRFSLSFCIASMSGSYEQRSQADIHSSVWDTSEGKFVLRPNVEAKFVLDDEVLASCKHFVAVPPDATDSTSGSDSERRSPWVDEARLSDRFGSDTLAKIGGLGILLQFLGVVCVDAGTSCYAKVLPFGLSADLFEVSDSYVPAGAEDVPRSPAGKHSLKTASTSGQKSKTGSSKAAAPPSKASAPPAPLSKATAQPAPSSREAVPAAPKVVAQQRPPVAPAAKASAMPAASGPAVVTLGLAGNASDAAASSSAARSAGSAAELEGASAAYPASNASTVAAPPVAPAAAAARPTPAAAKAPEAQPPAPPARPNSRSRPRPGMGGASAKSGSADAGPSSPKAKASSPKAGAASPPKPRQSSRGARASSGRRSAGGSG